MPNDPPATSILELLTHPNPTVSHLTPTNKTNTRGKNWHTPRRLKRWDDFDNFNILEASFGGHLLQEARRRGRDFPPYPHTHPEYDCVIRDEDDTRDLLHKWNRTIVNAALDAIQYELHPAIWCKGKADPPSTKETSEPPPEPEKKRELPPRKCSAEAKTPKGRSLARLKPDSGSSWSNPSLPESDARRRERFPKEYKPARKWESKWMVERELINDAGEWEKGKSNHNVAMPIRQAYTYCVKHMCRYGCILTCQEAFIFRVKPLDKEPVGGSQDPRVLKRQLTRNGLMEYISIPWDNHSQGEVDGHDTWTVNLALWFVHVLAGNNYEAGWQYGRLEDEKLAASNVSAPRKRNDERIAVFAKGIRDEDEDEDEDGDESDGSSDSGESDVTVPFEISPLMKRKRKVESEDVEGYNLSFTKRQFVEV
ncbi:hypothetical protein EDB81DRAFT_802894 [Dactylonectria macrodidyma]|uniref:Uncharacterized protein n=1 Tax=Dactylonectria macrodidyma TaxID=307937 RepID=A0A9P9IX95_9HYPO|nr:hypothetical protein EDB81DRAFT_802894 [Dactylonectria macrodidyma]